MFPDCISEILIQVHREQRDEMIEYAVECGHGVEIADFYWPNVLDDWAKCKELIAWYKERLPEVSGTISFHGAFQELTPSAQDHAVRRAARERIRRCLNLAQEFGCTYMVSHSDFNPARVNPGYLSDWAKRLACFWQEAMEGRSITVLIENIWDPNPTSIYQIVDEAASDSVGACLDIGTRTYGAAFQFEEWVSNLGSRIKYLHLHDNVQRWDQHMVPGKGTVDWTAAFCALHRQGIAVPATLEMRSVADAKAAKEFFTSLTEDNDVGCGD